MKTAIENTYAKGNGCVPLKAYLQKYMEPCSQKIRRIDKRDYI
jgi:hypothetical protein